MIAEVRALPPFAQLATWKVMIVLDADRCPKFVAIVAADGETERNSTV
ncbi:MAG: hypothetical protein RIC55_03120 [Pirellulaceae bacterium]